jgi:hypothetical protein
MIRPPATLLALFLAPFIAYAVVVWLTGGHLFGRGRWRLKTLMTLAICGLMLMLGNLIYLSHFTGASPGSTYEPARFEDGRVVPGRAR